MANPTYLKRFSAISVALGLIGLGSLEASGQDLDRVNQDELASFYGRMNVVVGSGARAFGMGGAFLARADDATAASWNPAGLSYLRRTEFSLVGAHNDFSQEIPRANTAVVPQINVITVDQLQASVADFLGFAWPIRIGERAGAVQVSYQRSFSFSGSRRSEGPVGVKGFAPAPDTVLPTEFTVEGRGGFDTVAVSSGFELHPKLRMGLSVNRWFRGFSQTVDRPDAQTGGYRRIDSRWDISGTNLNAGLLVTPVPRLNLGAVFKTAFSADVELSKTREDRILAVPEPSTGASLVSIRSRNEGKATIRFPHVYGVGASYLVTNTLTVCADFTRTAWSKATIAGFFSLGRTDIDRFGTLPFPAVEEGVNGQSDTSQVRMGAEWVLRLGESSNVLLPLRAGLFRDGQPVTIRFNTPAPSEVRPTFTGLTAGVGVTGGGVIFDVAYIRETGNVPSSRLRNGTIDSETRIRYSRIFASMIIRFGPRR